MEAAGSANRILFDASPVIVAAHWQIADDDRGIAISVERHQAVGNAAGNGDLGGAPAIVSGTRRSSASVTVAPWPCKNRRSKPSV